MEKVKFLLLAFLWCSFRLWEMAKRLRYIIYINVTIQVICYKLKGIQKIVKMVDDLS